MSSKSSIFFFIILVTTITPLLSLNPPTVVHQQTNRLGGEKSNGLTAELIHRDNPHSPFYNHSLSKYDRVIASFQRSHSRSLYLSNRRRYHNDALEAGVTEEDHEYVMSFYIGTPPVRTYAIVDTGSHMFWLQCEPCEKCFKQTIPIFNPAQSQTYMTISCNDPRCDLLEEESECVTAATDTCLYYTSYADNSYSRGNLSLETLTFDQDMSVTDVAFGCGLHNVDTGKGDTKPPGIIGLVREPLSFVIQQNIRTFSYCLAENRQDYKSVIHFRWDDYLPFQVQNTPMLDDPSFYYLSLEGISVGTTRLPLPEGFFGQTSTGDGGFIIDSGTPFTKLKGDALVKLRDEMRRQIKDLTEIHSPDERLFCYKTEFEIIKRAAPDLTFHFSGGLDLVINKEGTWVAMGDNVFCLAIAKSLDDMSIFGNVQQINYNIGYDLSKKRVSFMRMESCNGI